MKTNTQAILQILKTTYPHAHIALIFRNPWELLVSVILSAQCTDIMVNKVTPRLFARYPTMQNLAAANQREVEDIIRSTGFYRNKAKHIIQAAAMIQTSFHGQVPKTMEELLKIPGVARKTANVVLANAYNSTPGIAVDTHVIRLSQRLRLVPLQSIGGKHALTFTKHGKSIIDYKKDADPIKIEKELMHIIPQSEWKTITYQLIDHGRTICKAIQPKCADCVLLHICPASRIG